MFDTVSFVVGIGMGMLTLMVWAKMIVAVQPRQNKTICPRSGENVCLWQRHIDKLRNEFGDNWLEEFGKSMEKMDEASSVPDEE